MSAARDEELHLTTSRQHTVGIVARISGLQQHAMVPQRENRLLNEKVAMVTVTIHESDKAGMKKLYLALNDEDDMRKQRR